MPRPRHHPAAIAEVVLHNEPPAARSVAQLLSRADQVAASRRGRSGAQECGPSTLHYPLAAGRGAVSGHQPQLLPAGRAAGRPRPEQAPTAGERTRCRRTCSDSRTGRRSRLAVGGSAAWLRGGGLTRRPRVRPTVIREAAPRAPASGASRVLESARRASSTAPGLLLTPVPWA